MARITLPYVVLALLLAMGASYLVSWQVARSLQGQLNAFLFETGRRAAEGIVDLERQNLALLRQVTFTEGLVEAAAAGDIPGLRELLVGLVINAQADVVEVLAVDGESLLTVYHRPGGEAFDYGFASGAPRGSLPFVERVLAGVADELGDKHAGLALDVELHPGSELAPIHVLYVAGPLRREGEMVGVVLVGSYLEKVVSRLTSQALAPVTVYGPGGQVLASRLLARPQDVPALGPELYRDLVDRSAREAPIVPIERRVQRPPVDIARHVEAFAPLRMRGGEIVALFSVALSSESVVEAGATSIRLLVVLFTVAVLAILLVGIFVARAITRPILELVGVARSIALGDLDASVEVSSKDEIGILQRAFQSMIEGLRERDLIRDTFGRYVDRDVAEQILSGQVDLGGKVEEVTIFFSDIRDFTSLTSGMSPPEVMEFLNQYISIIVGVVGRYGGVVNKFGGDSAMVIFGAPIPAADHAMRALEAALSIRGRLEKFNVQRVRRAEVPIRTGFGLDSGEVVAGNVGSRERMEYTVIGEAVNLAARIQALSKDYPDYDLLISERTYRALPDPQRYLLRPLGEMEIRGVQEPLRLYAVLGFAQGKAGRRAAARAVGRAGRRLRSALRPSGKGEARGE